MNKKADSLVEKMTLEEKASLCVGADFWHTAAVERLGIPATMVSDGPHGLRKQERRTDHLGMNESIKAVCFPAGCGTAASFNRELVTMMGETLGNECQAEGISVLLGPAMNIKRSPLCGRNFEYYSEDPCLTTEIASSLIHGVQSRKVGTSPKHFLANNQEHKRMSSSSEVDERTLREIYLAGFEGVVKKEHPWTMMCSYNKINGTYSAENKRYLTDILRDEWGFDGYVVSDWGAVNDRIKDLKAGLDLEMPYSKETAGELIAAVENGTLEEETLNTACKNILNIVFRFQEGKNQKPVFDLEADHKTARKIAEETIVLLKNEQILPLSKGMRTAIIGKYAQSPRFQGGGSSHINSFKVSSAWDAMNQNPKIHAVFAQGFDDKADVSQPELLNEAVELAKEAEVAVIFAGLPDNFESEGYDRKHMHLPDCQNALIEAVCQVQKQVVVVLHNGSPVEMPWISKVKGVVEAYLGGQAVGEAVTDILYGDVNPSAKLPETFPIHMEDNPSYPYFGGEENVVEYREGVFVGYRYYDIKKMEVLFPFGHGLSYTQFSYDNLVLDKDRMKDTQVLEVRVNVTNTGKISGKEIVQLYIASPEDSKIIRPIKELRGFDKVELEPGETKTVVFTLDKRAFSYWNTNIHDWVAPSGEYGICLAASSRDIRCEKKVFVESTTRLPRQYTLDTTIGELLEDSDTCNIVKPVVDKERKRMVPDAAVEGAISSDMMNAMIIDLPLRNIASMGHMEKADIIQLLSIIKKSISVD